MASAQTPAGGLLAALVPKHRRRALGVVVLAAAAGYAYQQQQQKALRRKQQRWVAPPPTSRSCGPAGVWASGACQRLCWPGPSPIHSSQRVTARAAAPACLQAR